MNAPTKVIGKWHFKHHVPLGKQYTQMTKGSLNPTVKHWSHVLLYSHGKGLPNQDTTLGFTWSVDRQNMYFYSKYSVNK